MLSVPGNGADCSGGPLPAGATGQAILAVDESHVDLGRSPIDDLDIAVAEYIDWFNHRRLHGEIGLIPPVELEDQHYRQNPATATVKTSVLSLHH